MAEDKNPEEKPSFFDFSDEEASSWPPTDSVPLEDETPQEPEAPTEDFDVEDLFSDDFTEASTPQAETTETTPDLETVTEEPIPNLELPDLVAAEPSPEPEKSSVEDLLPDFEPIQKSEPEPDFDLTSPEPDLSRQSAAETEAPVEQELSFGEMQEAIEAQATDEPVFEEDDEGLISVTEPMAATIDEKLEQESVDALYSDYSAPEPDPVANIIDETEDTLPFRTFTTYDYSEGGISEADLNVDEEEKPGLSRNALIVIAVFLIIGGWYGFQALFSRDYSSKRGRERKARAVRTKKIALQEKELIPVWELSNQTFTNAAGENILIKDMYYEAGRENPFMLPDSVLADMVRAAELELIKNQKPNTYRRTAYRATLIGVLTSKESTIALVDYQEAVFDVLEGTTKEKILKLAVKAMDKTKENTQEMIVGSFIGPWQITKIDAPEDPFIEPRITLEHNYQTKVINMGKAMELGIFDEDGNFDNLDEPVDEVAIDKFEW